MSTNEKFLGKAEEAHDLIVQLRDLLDAPRWALPPSTRESQLLAVLADVLYDLTDDRVLSGREAPRSAVRS